MTMLRSCERWLVGPEASTRSIALVRIGIGLIICSRFSGNLAVFNSTDWQSIPLAATFYTVCGMMIFGYRAQIASGCVALIVTSIYLTGSYGNAVEQWNHHQVYLLISASALLACSPCGRSYSIDRYLACGAYERGEAPLPRERGTLWGQRLIVVQLAALYFWAAFDKSDWGWISGQRLEQILVWFYASRPLEAILRVPQLIAISALVVLLVEYFLAFAILSSRLRVYAIPIGLLLHALFYILLPVGTYSITMIVLYIAIPDADWVHEFLDRLQGHASLNYNL